MEQQFLKVFDEHSDAIFRYCYFRVYDRELAKDLVQDAFTKTWLTISEGKKIKNMRAFIYKVLKNLIIDNSRKKKEMSLDKLQLEKGFDVTVDNREELDAKIDIKEVVDCLPKLNEKYRDVILMRYVEGLQPAEIAEILDLPVNTVSVRITRGVKKLKRILIIDD